MENVPFPGIYEDFVKRDPFPSDNGTNLDCDICKKKINEGEIMQFVKSVRENEKDSDGIPDHDIKVNAVHEECKKRANLDIIGKLLDYFKTPQFSVTVGIASGVSVYKRAVRETEEYSKLLQLVVISIHLRELIIQYIKKVVKEDYDHDYRHPLDDMFAVCIIALTDVREIPSVGFKRVFKISESIASIDWKCIYRTTAIVRELYNGTII